MAQELQGFAAQFKIDESEMAQVQSAVALPEPDRISSIFKLYNIIKLTCK